MSPRCRPLSIGWSMLMGRGELMTLVWCVAALDSCCCSELFGESCLLHLAERVARQRLDDMDPTRALVNGELSSHMIG